MQNRLTPKIIYAGLMLLLLATLTWAAATGAVKIKPVEMYGSLRHWMTGQPPQGIYEAVFIQLRLPRVLLCALVGAILAVSGLLMQGLFRNPIVEPGLIGTSSGAAFGASIVFVLGPRLSPELKSLSGPLVVPMAAFLGALLATWMVYLLAGQARRLSVMSLLLVGIAINAMALSGTGFMSYIARDPQARSITFWNLGNFSGASWWQVGLVSAVASSLFILAMRYAKALNALLLGEEEAGYLGVDTRKLKRRIMLLNTALVAVATAFVGVIAFMGLIVPHIMRLMMGSDNKRLLPACMLCGALLMVLSDLGARMLLAPAEVPVGIITSAVGAPVFILLLRQFQTVQEKGGYHA